MSYKVQPLAMERCTGCMLCMLACSRVNEGVISLEKSRIKIKTGPAFSHTYIVVICAGCRDPPCAKVCPTGALQPRPGGGVIFTPSLCNGCKKCVNACVINAIGWDEEKNKPLICTHCGYCISFCPNNVLSYVSTEHEVI